MPSTSDIAVSVRGLSKAYTIARLGGGGGHVTLAEAALARLRNPLRRSPTETFHALSDVTFDVKKGDVVGIIGRNGAGKSTLLKILSRITEPTAGQIDLYGRVGSLLEVGTGFHPELTGRENVFLNGAILGMTKAEIRTPVRRDRRLRRRREVPRHAGQAVQQRHVRPPRVRRRRPPEPEILIVDEVLAVGDAAFQKKCIGKMQELAGRQSRTILFVSHNVAAIATLCNRCLFLEAGRVRLDAATPAAISAYVQSGVGPSGSYEREADPRRPVQVVGCSTGDGGRAVAAHEAGRPVTVHVRVACQAERAGLELTVQLANASMQPVFSANLSDWTGRLAELAPGTHEFEMTIPADFLAPGEYAITVGLHQPGVEVVEVVENAARFNIEEVGSAMARYQGHNYGSVLVNFEWRERSVTESSPRLVAAS